MKKILIFGTGGMGRKVYEMVSEERRVVGFLDNDASRWGKTINGVPVLGNADVCKEMEYDEVVVCSQPGRTVIEKQLHDVGVPRYKVNCDFFENDEIAVMGFTPEMAELCGKNAEFKDTHVGDRCFVLGNGPSLRDVNLADLADEFVFTVNDFSEVENYKEARTNVHVYTGPEYFGFRKEYGLDMERVIANHRAIARERALFFVPIYGHEFILKNNLDSVMNVRYFCRTIPPISEQVSYDITQPFGGVACVIPTAVLIAIYMGFSKIYLLGCDFTYIIAELMEALGKPMDGEQIHCIKNNYANDVYRRHHLKYSVSYLLQESSIHARSYEKLNQLCIEKGIKLFNCSSQTLLDSIPRMDLDDVLRSNKGRTFP